MEKRELICTACPYGCRLTAEIEDSTVKSVEGNRCLRGKKYAESECINPMRTFATTVKVKQGGMLPVKTRDYIQKSAALELMKILKNVEVLAPVNIGDVIVKDVFGTDVVACAKVKGE